MYARLLKTRTAYLDGPYETLYEKRCTVSRAIEKIAGKLIPTFYDLGSATRGLTAASRLSASEEIVRSRASSLKWTPGLRRRADTRFYRGEYFRWELVVIGWP